MDSFWHIVLPAGFGALMQEGVYWWQLRFNLDADKYDVILRSVRYWGVVILMIAGSAIGTYFWLGDESTASTRDCMVFGAAFPLMLKHAVGAASTGRRTLGARAEKPNVLLSYFRMR